MLRRTFYILIASTLVASILFYFFSGKFVYFDEGAMVAERSFKVFQYQIYESPLVVIAEALAYFSGTVAILTVILLLLKWYGMRNDQNT
jgi:ABC-type multidrug transport system permease subunit